VLPIGPEERRALPIGPRAAVPAGRRALTRRERKARKKLPLAPPPAPEELISPLADIGPWGDPRDEPPLVLEASDPKQMVRPYTRTGGRTHVGYRLELETLLTTTQGREYDIATLRDDHSAICEMCRAPQSVAEIAAKLVLPLGAARVLISDVVDFGLLSVHETSAADGPTIDLMQRIAAGLRKL
jgi:hypothetical protein